MEKHISNKSRNMCVMSKYGKNVTFKERSVYALYSSNAM